MNERLLNGHIDIDTSTLLPATIDILRVLSESGKKEIPIEFTADDF